MKKSVTATVLACALVVGGVGLTPAGASESGADICYYREGQCRKRYR